MTVSDNFPELIRENVYAIMKQWEKVVRIEDPAAAPLKSHELFNGLPFFLENLASSFSVKIGSAEWKDVALKKTELAKIHGTQRAIQPAYTLDQVISEHQILRRILFQFLSKKSSITLDQCSVLMNSIDVGISEAASAFALERGFKDAKYKQLQLEKSQIQIERNTAYSEVSKLELERAMREKFVSTLSHDMRTPISSAKLAAELILRLTQENEQVSKLTRKIIKDLSRSDRMIRDLLDANRIRFGEKLPLKIQETKLIQLIKNTLENLTEIYGDRFKLESDHEILGYWSDEDLQRAIENLAINAVKYGADHTPIDIRVADQGKEVSISVHNSGSFIPPMERDSLLQVDKRVEHFKKQSKKGWGLGLTLVYGISEAHGGKVLLESEIKKGTTFTLVLPKDARTIENKGTEQALVS